MKPHYTLFISDLHLSESQPEIANIFLNLLKAHDPQLDALYILGDFFETWIGDDNHSAFNQKIKIELQRATLNGLPIYFMHGNRDFLIGKKFLKETGCQLLDEETLITLYGTPVLLMHGDTLCTLDVNYLKLRKRIRHPFLQKLFLNLPLRLRQSIANRMRMRSESYIKMTSIEKMDVTDYAVQEVLQKHHVNFLIHGHTHQLAVHRFAINNQPHERIVLGAWHKKGNAFYWDNAGKKKLIELG